MLRSLSPTLLQILGMFMLIRGFTAWRESGQLEITTAQLVAVVVVGLTALLLARFADPVVRFCADHRVALVIPMASGAALGFSPRFLNEGIWQVAVGWSLAAGSAALIGGAFWAIMRRPASGSRDGPITSPLDTMGEHPGYGIPGPLLKLVSSSMLGTVCFTSLTVLLLAWIWWLTRAQ